MARAGTKPRSLTSDLGPEFEGPFKQMLEANGIEAFQKRKEDINAIATIDTAIWESQEGSRPGYAKSGHQWLGFKTRTGD